jgi:uncharacterized membrane protein
MGRLLSFSDNVYAFAITLLGTQFKMPDPQQVQSSSDLTLFLADLRSPALASYALSFFVIALFWTLHAKYFRHIERQNGTLRVLNLIHLMTVAVIPFSTDLLSTFVDDELPFILYAVTAGVAAMSLAVIQTYAMTNHRLVDRDIPWPDLRIRILIAWVTPLCYFLSLAIAMIDYRFAWIVWSVPLIGIRVFRMNAIAREEREVRAERASPGDVQ